MVQESKGLYWPDWGSLAVALIAVVQPWAISLYKRLRHKGAIDTYQTGFIEVGFSNYGHTLGLLGTLRGSYQDVFVTRIHLIVTREKDQATQRFGWRAFRGNTSTLGKEEEVSVEAAGSFLVTHTAPHKYNIFFVSEGFAAEHGAAANAVTEEWNKFIHERLKEIEPNWNGQVSAVLADPALSSSLFDGFLKTRAPTDLFTRLNNAFFWHPGSYRIRYVVECAKPDRHFSKTWGFTLTEQDSEQLRLNAIGVLRVLCGIPATFKFSYPEYAQAPALPARAG